MSGNVTVIESSGGRFFIVSSEVYKSLSFL